MSHAFCRPLHVRCEREGDYWRADEDVTGASSGPCLTKRDALHRCMVETAYLIESVECEGDEELEECLHDGEEWRP